MHQSNSFICGIKEEELSALITKIAPQCSDCLRSKTQLCIEECCRQTPLFCKSCGKESHFLHRTNDLYLLFVNIDLIST